MYPYRIFVSYAHQDKNLVGRIVDSLADLGAIPVFDEDLLPGREFNKDIRTRISHSHALLPILTKSSTTSAWVHQEIGYAMGSNVPILPVFVGASHAEDIKGRLGLAGRIHALRISDERSDIQSLFHEQMFEDVLDNRGLADEDPGGPLPRFECAFSSQERTSTLFSHLNRARGLPGKARGRYCGALTSFALPSTRIGDPIWSRIDGPPRQGRPPRREDAILKKLRDERRHLQAHSSTHGCDLIVEPSVALKRLGPEAAGARAEVLRAFLRDVTRDPTRDQMRVVVMSQTESRDRNPESTCYGSLMIFGDWFVAESRTPLDGPGYRQTTFTSHAPTVLSGIRECDLDFDEIYAEHEPYFQRSEYQGSSVRAAIDLLTAFIAKCAELVRLAQAD